MTSTLIDTVYSQLRDKIVDRTIAPGTKLSEPSLTRILGVSRTPIREVLRRLEAEGFVTSTPHKGFVVNTICLGDIDKIYTIKISLEGLAGRLATSNISQDPNKVKTLQALCKEMEACFKTRDAGAYVALNDKFHSFVSHSCGNEWLIKILDQLSSQVNRFIVKSLHVPGRMEKSVREHREIVGRVMEGDSAGVERAISTHFKKASEDLKREFIEKI